jgi:hypothetical protein
MIVIREVDNIVDNHVSHLSINGHHMSSDPDKKQVRKVQVQLLVIFIKINDRSDC